MGGAESQSKQVLKYFDKEWEYISTSSDGVKVYRNRDNDKEAESHTVDIIPQRNLNKEYDIYNYRRTQDNALVSVYAVNSLKNTQPNLCGNRDIFKVMVQRIPVRAHQLKGLSFPEGVYLLSQSLRGYQDCYDKVGPFSISDDMMGLNTSGQVKVWLNDKFGENHPPNEKPVLQITQARQFRQQTYQEQQAMVESLLKVVQPKCRDKFPQDFTNLLRQQTTFCGAYQAIQQYCGAHRVDVPDRILLEGRQKSVFQPFATVTKENRGEDREKNKNQSDFSFKQTNTGRETIINNLIFDPKQNHYNGVVEPRRQVTELSFNTPNNHQSYNPPPYPSAYNQPTTHLSYNPNLSYSPPKIQHQQQSLYTGQPQHFSYQQQKISLKPNTQRGPSPARGVNFSYQSGNYRSMSPFGSNYVASQRF